jgi:hypothetical protein
MVGVRVFGLRIELLKVFARRSWQLTGRLNQRRVAPGLRVTALLLVRVPRGKEWLLVCEGRVCGEGLVVIAYNQWQLEITSMFIVSY